jgi:hypothetical protein
LGIRHWNFGTRTTLISFNTCEVQVMHPYAKSAFICTLLRGIIFVIITFQSVRSEAPKCEKYGFFCYHAMRQRRRKQFVPWTGYSAGKKKKKKKKKTQSHWTGKTRTSMMRTSLVLSVETVRHARAEQPKTGTDERGWWTLKGMRQGSVPATRVQCSRRTVNDWYCPNSIATWEEYSGSILFSWKNASCFLCVSHIRNRPIIQAVTANAFRSNTVPYNTLALKTTVHT